VIVVEEIDRGEGGIHGCLDEQDLEGPVVVAFDVDGLEGYIGVWDRSSKKESAARDSIAGTVLAIRDEELGVEGEYFPLSSVVLCLA
jgi:hypothetical protein